MKRKTHTRKQTYSFTLNENVVEKLDEVSGNLSRSSWLNNFLELNLKLKN